MKSSRDEKVRRFLGLDMDPDWKLGLSADWTQRVIKQVGNYGESYERTVGMGSALKLKRGQNALLTKGALLFPPPFP